MCMEGDVIVMQDVFVFEQTGVVEGKIQAASSRPASGPSSSRSSRSMCIHLLLGLFGASY